MGLDLALDRAGAEAGGEGAGRRLRRLPEPARVARFDLAAQRAALAEADGRIARGGGPAALRERLDLDAREAGLPEFVPDDPDIVIAVGRAGQELWRVGGEQGRHRVGQHAAHLVLLDPVPDTEEEAPAGPEHAQRLAIARAFVG